MIPSQRTIVCGNTHPLTRSLLVTVTRMVSPQSALITGPDARLACGDAEVIHWRTCLEIGLLKEIVSVTVVEISFGRDGEVNVPLMSIAFFLGTPSPPTQLSCSVITKLYCVFMSAKP